MQLPTFEEDDSCTQHALGWLALANLIGVWLALLQVVPEANRLLGPLTYGRWVPLHLNFQLYGWLSLPILPLLLRFVPNTQSPALTRLAVRVWSLSLAWGGITWLLGQSSGKLFLDWTGSARVGFGVALGLLWLVLVQRGWDSWPQLSRGRRALALVAVLLLAPVPWLWLFSGDPSVYPPVNPHSGGATGSSLLGSTLVVVALFLVTPTLLSAARADRKPRTAWLGILLLVHLGLFLPLAAGHHSNHDPVQLLALGSLGIWVPLLVWHTRCFDWPSVTRRWWLAWAVWWLVLVGLGFLAFLPDVLVRWKFSHALVGHAHLAMAGMMTSFHMATILARDPQRTQLARPGLFWLWHGALAAMIGCLTWLGERQFAVGAVLVGSDDLATGLLWLRLGLGLVMTGVSWLWWLSPPLAEV